MTEKDNHNEEIEKLRKELEVINNDNEELEKLKKELEDKDK